MKDLSTSSSREVIEGRYLYTIPVTLSIVNEDVEGWSMSGDGLITCEADRFDISNIRITPRIPLK